MKKFRTLAAILMIALVAAVLAACGGSSAGVKKGEDFTVGEFTMKYDSAEVSGSEATVTVLLKGRTGMPVTFNNGQMSVTINAKLGEGENAIRATKLSAKGIAENVTDEEYGARISYTFENIGDADYPTATIFLSADESQNAVLDFQSGLGDAGSPAGGAASTGIIIAIVLVALAVAGGIFAAKKGFFKKDPGPGAAGMTPSAPAAAPAAPVTQASVSAPAAPVIRLDTDDAPIPSSAPAEAAAGTEPEAPEKTYSESDNMGTRHDNVSQAMAYWMGERLMRPEKPPFTMYTMPSAEAGEEALLELPFMHRAADSGRLICDRLMTFGCYETTLNGQPTGEYEAMITGSDLTLEDYELLEKAFEARGGRLKSHEAPSADAAAEAAPAGDASKVSFVETVKGGDGVSTYEVYKGPDKASAMEFLRTKPVTQPMYYVVVDTPEGSFGRDIQGFYQE